MIIEIGLSWASGKCLDNIYDVLREDTSLHEHIIEAVNKAVKRAFQELIANEWDDEAFKKYCHTYITDANSKRVLSADNETFIDILSNYFDESQQPYVTEELLAKFTQNCLEEYARDATIAQYILLSELLQKKQEEKKVKEEHDKIFKLLQAEFKENKSSNMYQDRKLLNTVFYPFVCDHLTQRCSVELVDMAYFMADIYDYTSEYEKSMKLAELIIKVIDPASRRFSTHHLRQLIGCIYSFIIPKIDDLTKKEEMLAYAEKSMKTVRNYIDQWNFESNAEKHFIEGLYASNYGAWLTNKADCAKRKKNKEQETYFLKEALEQHKKAKIERGELLDHYISPLETISREDVEAYYNKSRSNIAGILFRMEKNDDALSGHRKVLEYQNKTGQETNTYMTKSYMIGCYIGKKINGSLLDAEREECFLYIDECKKFYRNKNDVMRLKDIEDKEKKFHEPTDTSAEKKKESDVEEQEESDSNLDDEKNPNQFQ